MGFQDLNVSKQILMALEEAGFENPTPIQEEVFSVSRSGRDLIGYCPDRYGKDAGLPDPDVDEIALCARVGAAGAGGCSHAGTGGAGVREC